MNNRIKLLSTIAVIQLIIILLVYRGSDRSDEQTLGSMLFDFDPKKVSMLEIQDDEKSVILKKRSGEWLTEDNFPADANKISELLERISQLESRIPIATSKSASDRFKVSEAEFERHVIVTSNDKVSADFYLGTGAGARRTHLRIMDNNNIHTPKIGIYDFDTDLSDWRDRKALFIDKKSISSIKLTGIELTRHSTEEDGETTDYWKSSTEEESDLIKHDEVDMLIDSLATLNYQNVLGADTKQEYKQDNPILECTVRYGDSTRTYTLSKPDEADHYILKISDRPEYFELSSSNGDDLIERCKYDTLFDEAVPDLEEFFGEQTDDKKEAE